MRGTLWVLTASQSITETRYASPSPPKTSQHRMPAPMSRLGTPRTLSTSLQFAF
jgi:hypothetical protein